MSDIIIITDEQLDKELDQLLSEYPKDTPYYTLMIECRRRFIDRKDLDIVALHLLEKVKKCE